MAWAVTFQDSIRLPETRLKSISVIQSVHENLLSPS